MKVVFRMIFRRLVKVIMKRRQTRMKKKWMTTLGAPLIALVLLSACGTANENNDEQPQDTNAPNTENQSNENRPNDEDTDTRQNYFENINAPTPRDNMDDHRDNQRGQDRGNNRDGIEKMDKKHRQ